ncbi:MAG: metalloregulator ArsR/SmtB family transcription factor [Propionibacteriaceae bacterium]|jgi:DNA-binding transcriptional ArsR family regulator|nr:metalloregulator ArsR/SmtB family transcription factor [Propionibacteriaceae bacterium]
MRLSPAEAEQVAETMSGLATPARILILARLLDAPATVSQLTAELELSQTAVSNHLRILRHLNLAAGSRQGRNVLYQLQDDHVRQMVQQVLSHTRHA